MTNKIKLAAIALGLVLACTLPAAADGFRDIATVSLDYYIDSESWRATYENVLLARILPPLTLHTKVAAYDAGPSAESWYPDTFQIGPVVSFTDSLYLIALYGIKIDSAAVLNHQIDLEMNYETATVATSLGVRAVMFRNTAVGDSYLLPSMSFRIRPIEPLGLFSKLFVSFVRVIDPMGRQWDVTGSFWGEADYAISSRLALRGGFTLSYADTAATPETVGLSLIGGINFQLKGGAALKYTFSWFLDSVQYLETVTVSDGVHNALTLDVRF